MTEKHSVLDRSEYGSENSGRRRSLPSTLRRTLLHFVQSFLDVLLQGSSLLVHEHRRKLSTRPKLNEEKTSTSIFVVKVQWMLVGRQVLTLIESNGRVLRPHGAFIVLPCMGSLTHVTISPAWRTALIRKGNLTRMLSAPIRVIIVRRPGLLCGFKISHN